MKKKITIIIAILSIISCMAFAIVGCDGNSSAIIKGVDGCKNVSIDNDAKTIALDVDCLVSALALSNFKVDKGVSVKAYYDESKSTLVENELPLEFGSNVFYVEATAKKASATYKVTINRERPSASVDPTKTVKSIEVAQAKTTYYVGETFAQGMLKVNYTDGSSGVVLMTSDMVSGFTTAEKGDVTVTVKLGEATATYTIKVVEVTVPQYPQVTPAQLDADIFADTVCKWYATICTYENREYLQEEYDYHYQRAKAGYYDLFYATSERFARSGLSTELFLNIDKYVSPILKNIQDMVFDVSEVERDDDSTFESMKVCLNVEKLKNMCENAKSLLAIIKPEYIATFVNNEFDDMIRDFINEDYNFGELAAAAEKAGLNEIAQLLKDKEKQFADSKVIGAYADYNSAAFVTDKAIKALDAILSFDLDAISSAILCITDIATMGSENFGDLAAGKGKYSYRDIITHANTVGDFLVTFVDSVEDKPILMSIVNKVLNKVFVSLQLGISAGPAADACATVFGNFDLYKSMGMLLKDLTVADITDIYMDFNDWQVANNNDKSEDECNAKFATLATRVAKLVGKALDYAGDRESVVISASNFIQSLFGITQINTSASDILKLIDKAQDIEDPTKMTNQQALEIYRLFESGVEMPSKREYLSYYAGTRNVKLGTSKADFVKMFSQGEFKKAHYDEESGDYIYEPLVVTQANIKDFDSSSEGYKSVTLSWGDLTAKIDYFVYSSETPKQMGIDWIQSYVSTYRRAVEKDAEVTLDEVLEYIKYDCYYTYVDPTSLFRVKVRPEVCDNLRLVGLDTSKAGDGVAYVVGEHEVMGTQVFPFYYYISGGEKTVERCYLSSSVYGYKIGDKFQGYFQVHYNDNTSSSLKIDEKNLSYDFTTTGCKTVTYTYEGKQYTCLVRVYSDGCAMEINYFDSWDSYSYLKDSSQEYVFRNSTIRFNAIDSLDISGMTVSEARKALKAVSADYDITIKGFDTNQEFGKYSVTITITKSGKIVVSRKMNYVIVDNIGGIIQRYGIIICTSDNNTDITGVTDINDLQIDHVLVPYDYAYFSTIYLSDLTELSKYGEFKYNDEYGRIVFVLSNGIYIGVYIQQQT